jgi:glyoxylase-like metal-dependent hydrolase (beta-lactamase superfamily II)
MGATPWRIARPRPRDEGFLSRLPDAGTPAAGNEVKLIPLVQSGRKAPSPVVAEGVWRPPRVSLGMTSFLVEHPRARFLIDPALCAGVHERVLPELPRSLRVFVSPDNPVTGLADALSTVGLTPGDVDFVLPTHLHWDHVSGLAELPGSVPVHVLRSERDFALGSGQAPLGVARTPLYGREFQHYDLDGGPVLTFSRSHDVFGDGSVLVVDLAGHTPGSVGLLLATSGGRRVLLAGDAAWHTLQITHLREKAPFPGELVDYDRRAAFLSLHRLHAVPRGITIVPSHDRDVVRSLVASQPGARS